MTAERIPISRKPRRIRTAISPRLAINTLRMRRLGTESVIAGWVSYQGSDRGSAKALQETRSEVKYHPAATPVSWFGQMGRGTVLRMYVDEVGNADLKASSDPNHRYLSLTGVVIDLDY